MRSFRFSCFALAAILAIAQTSAKDALPDLVGRIVGVHDGDSITLLTEAKEQVKIRLEGIDAPELKQPFSNAAKQALSAMVFDKQVVIRNKGQDRYKRTLGRVFCGGMDVNLEMVKQGFAWRYDKYSKEPALIEAQKEAKAARRGLWSDKEPAPPWEWRKKKTEKTE
jgi:micrococcal nuclease